MGELVHSWFALIPILIEIAWWRFYLPRARSLHQRIAQFHAEWGDNAIAARLFEFKELFWGGIFILYHLPVVLLMIPIEKMFSFRHGFWDLPIIMAITVEIYSLVLISAVGL